jgi:hypothetical protein
MAADDVEARVSKLVAARAALFEKSGASFGLSDADQAKLKGIEQELDECFLARRQQRALVDARRFDREANVIRPTRGTVT